jgi:hypothetical protein
MKVLRAPFALIRVEQDAPVPTGKMRTSTAKAASLSGTCGPNYGSSSAVGTSQFLDDYDYKTIRRELGYAVRIGLNSVRVVFQYLGFEHRTTVLENFAASCGTARDNGAVTSCATLVELARGIGRNRGAADVGVLTVEIRREFLRVGSSRWWPRPDRA